MRRRPEGDVGKEQILLRHPGAALEVREVAVHGVEAQRHVRLAAGTPVTNLYVTLLDKIGVPVETIGDSSGRFEHLSDV